MNFWSAITSSQHCRKHFRQLISYKKISIYLLRRWRLWIPPLWWLFNWNFSQFKSLKLKWKKIVLLTFIFACYQEWAGASSQSHVPIFTRRWSRIKRCGSAKHTVDYKFSLDLSKGRICCLVFTSSIKLFLCSHVTEQQQNYPPHLKLHTVYELTTPDLCHTKFFLQKDAFSNSQQYALLRQWTLYGHLPGWKQCCESVWLKWDPDSNKNRPDSQA
jgi:hypothetical protein